MQMNYIDNQNVRETKDMRFMWINYTNYNFHTFIPKCNKKMNVMKVELKFLNSLKIRRERPVF